MYVLFVDNSNHSRTVACIVFKILSICHINQMTLNDFLGSSSFVGDGHDGLPYTSYYPYQYRRGDIGFTDASDFINLR